MTKRGKSLHKTNLQINCKFLLQFAPKPCIISLARKRNQFAIYKTEAPFRCKENPVWNCFWMFWREPGRYGQDAALSVFGYLFIEYVEHRHGEKIEAVLERSGRWGLSRRRCWAVCRSAAFRPLHRTLCLPRHLAGHPHRGVPRHQRRGGAAADLDAGVLG